MQQAMGAVEPSGFVEISCTKNWSVLVGKDSTIQVFKTPLEVPATKCLLSSEKLQCKKIGWIAALQWKKLDRQCWIAAPGCGGRVCSK